MSKVPLQTGLPTLVPNFYPALSTPDPTGQGKSVMQNTPPGNWPGADARADATNTVTVGGTIHTGDVLGVTLANGVFPGGSLAYSYTVLSSDTLISAAQALAALINNDPNAQDFDIEADTAGAVITIYQEGPIGNGTGLTVGVTGGGATTTLTAGAATFSGGTGPVIPTQNFTWSVNGVMMTFYYGVPQDVPINTLLGMIAQGAPIS